MCVRVCVCECLRLKNWMLFSKRRKYFCACASKKTKNTPPTHIGATLVVTYCIGKPGVSDPAAASSHQVLRYENLQRFSTSVWQPSAFLRLLQLAR
jgi:hypothetical protein